MQRVKVAVGVGLLLCMASLSAAVAQAEELLFDRENLVAWCIVPFDAKQRGPEERAAMLERLGIRQLAYDWRAEHVPQFDEEVAAMQRHGVQIRAWWMAPPDLNETNRLILDVVRRHGLKLQFWVLVPEPIGEELTQADKVRIVAEQIRPLAEEAAALECQVGLYNHGGWFGEPENQLAVLRTLEMPNVGIVYNLHHGHAHVERFGQLLDEIKPHLLALNLNGMTKDGDQIGQKILPIGTGELDLQLLRTIRDSGYRGPIGILNHTDLDAEARLADNLLGLQWLVEQLDGRSAEPLPRLETYEPGPAEKDRDAAGPEANPDRARVEALLQQTVVQGTASRGAAVFTSAKFACISCHRIGEYGGTIGPELTTIGVRQTADAIVEAILWPNRTVQPEYVAHAIVTDSGLVHQGYIVAEDDAKLLLRVADSCEPLMVSQDEVVDRQQIGSVMPQGLFEAMTATERHDLLRFLLDLGRPGSEPLYELVQQAQAAAQFAYEKGPLVPGQWRFATHPVNRDRIYDYYAKQADYFRDLGPASHVLPPYPGLDGGELGHWGNQDEATWSDDRWGQMDSGSVQCGIFRNPSRRISRGVCVRLAGPEQWAACFNPETLQYEVLWQGGFVTFSSVRHGFVDDLLMQGEEIPCKPVALPQGDRRYRGYYRHGEQTIFAYDVDGRAYLDAPEIVDGKLVRAIAPAAEHPRREVLLGGPLQWPDVIETQGELSTGQGYVIDSIALPKDNPWNALMFVGGHDFMADGTAMLCTMQGDVWHVAGLDATLDRVRWKRFAAGLHHPLGLVVKEDQVYVLGRNQITRLHDLNGDGEADFYECFSKGFETSPAGHDFICGLECDAQGNFYTASGNQGLLRVSADGTTVDVLATGFRNPDGLCVLPTGEITVPCSEGEWTPASMICLVPPQTRADELPLHYGYPGPRAGGAPELPLVYLPRGLDNSSGGQVYIDSQQWGPLSGQMIHLSFGAGTYFLLLRDEVAGQSQGAVVPLPGDFASGVHRGRFHPHDGQLYVSGMSGWGTYTPEDGCFERVRFTGSPVQMPSGFHVHENGIRVTFTEAVDPAIATDTTRQFAQAWNYRYSSAYGSAEYAPSHFGMVGHDRLPIASVHVLDAGHSLFLEIPDLQPVNQLHLRLQVGSGEPVDLFATIHALDDSYTEFDGYQPTEKLIAAHPLLADLELLAKPPRPNPFREVLSEACEIRMEAGSNLSFATRALQVSPGETLKLTFANPDVVPHNWVLVRPDSLQRVGALVNQLVADPEAATRQYVPDSDDVLVYTDIVAGREETTIYFHAPQEPGRYPYLCSFPGHWMVMNGLLLVE